MDKEMTVAEAEEKNAQQDYEELMKDSAEKRTADSKSLSEKESAKADTQAMLEKHHDDKASTEKERWPRAQAIRRFQSARSCSGRSALVKDIGCVGDLGISAGTEVPPLMLADFTASVAGAGFGLVSLLRSSSRVVGHRRR